MIARFLAPLLAAVIGLPSAFCAASQSLDGQWLLARDAKDTGIGEHWYQPESFPVSLCRPVPVPGNINEAWENPAPVTTPEAANLDWYRLAFTAEVPEHLHYYLRFGAVRYLSRVWLNGTELGTHEGGQNPFDFDVTRLLRLGHENTLIVRVSSPYFGGINQHVLLVAQPSVRIIDAFARPDAASKVMHLDVTMENNTDAPADVALAAVCSEFRSKQKVCTQNSSVSVAPGRTVVTLELPVEHPHLWDLDDPFLYSVDVRSTWSSADGGEDAYAFRTGFRDFRIKNGFFELNGRRIFVKSTHGNWYDPIVIQGNSRDMKYLRRDMPQLKKAGFNMLRLIISAALPEQLDEADEMGFLVYSEHETSWQLKDPEKFGISLNGVVRRDRNHPSLVLWGLLNETSSLPIFERARAWLPSLRAIDPTRLVLISSGRWDKQFKTGSASNPGSNTWNVYLGGEDPVHPVSTGNAPGTAGAFYPGTGDAHIYQRYPTTWPFAAAFEKLGRGTHPFFLSEAGDGSSYDPFDEQRKLEAAGAPSDCYASTWIDPAIKGLQGTWRRYGLAKEYPSIESMLVDSALAESRQRELMFSLVRGNPQINGYNLTSLNDCWGTGEGVMDNFRDFKPGHEAVLREGWAPLRWSILLNQTNVYAGQPLHVRLSLADDHALAPGDYGAALSIAGKGGQIWKTRMTVHIVGGSDAPLAYLLFDQDIPIPPNAAGGATIEASLDGRANAAASTLKFTVSRREDLPRLSGRITVCGLDPEARRLLEAQGAVLEEYSADRALDHEVIFVGNSFSTHSADWRSLYTKIARGAAAVFLSPSVFAASHSGRKDALSWLALSRRGVLVDEIEWLYHKDIVAKKGSAFAGLQTGLMTPEYYEMMIAHAPFFEGIELPDEADAVAIRDLADGAAKYIYHDGLELGVYRHHAGCFTLCGLDVLGNIGHPAADHLILNLASQAAKNAAALSPLPSNYGNELAGFGLVEGD
jgi:hypothetical protein